MKNYLKIILAIIICMYATCCMSGKGGNRGGEAKTNNSEQINTPQTSSSTIIEGNATSNGIIAIADHPIVNVYLENSGSMNGYVDNGKTLFQQDVYNYLCDIHISEIASEINLHFINSQIINKGSVIEDFINKLTPNSFKTSGGKTTTTDIADVFKQVLNRTDDNTVSIFISDCIFSPGSVTNPQAYLANQQVGIKKCFADHLTQYPNFSVLVYQLYSNFSGTYYDYMNRPRKYNGERPYYIWVMGHTANIAKLRAYIPNEKFSGSGVANMWCAFNHTVEDLSYSIVPKAIIGDFNKVSKNSISRIKKTNGEFAFQVLAKLDVLELMLGNDYLMDTNNYACLINKYDTDEWYIDVERNTNASSPATHNIILGTTKNTLSGTLSVAIRCKSPKWAYELTDDDDSSFTDENNRKTYGLKYMIDGIQQAFEAKSSGDYTVMDFKLN